MQTNFERLPDIRETWHVFSSVLLYGKNALFFLAKLQFLSRKLVREGIRIFVYIYNVFVLGRTPEDPE